jgi:scyllo-inositol 2-dehydrogenase (NADP+)
MNWVLFPPMRTEVVLIFSANTKLSGEVIHLRYLDPASPLGDLKANPGTPGAAFGITGTYDSGEKLVWIEKNIAVSPAQSFDIWDEIYAAYRLDKPYPIRIEEALEVVRIIDEVKRGTEFA